MSHLSYRHTFEETAKAQPFSLPFFIRQISLASSPRVQASIDPVLFFHSLRDGTTFHFICVCLRCSSSIQSYTSRDERQNGKVTTTRLSHRSSNRDRPLTTSQSRVSPKLVKS